MRVLIVGLIAAACLGACATPAAEPTPPAPSNAAAPAVTEADKKTCRSMPVTGSNMTQRVCLTQAEWNARAKQGQADIDEFNRRRDETDPTRN